jgi:hypothetical protein
MANLNFLNPALIRDATAQCRDASGEVSVLDAIRKAHSHGPSQGDPVQLAKRHKARADQDENDDDMDTDEDLDMALTDTERADLRARRKAKKDANAKRGEAAKRAIKSLHAEGSTPFDPDWVRKGASVGMRYVDNRASVQAVRKAHLRPLPMYPSHNVSINEADIQRIIADGKAQMRKGGGVSREKRRQIIDQVVRENPNCNTSSELSRLVAHAISKADSSIRFSSRPAWPPESANATWTQQLANTGAANNWRDEDTQRPGVERVGGYTDSSIGPNDARIRAAVASVTSTRDVAVEAIKADWLRTKMKQAQEFANRPAARGSGDTQKLAARLGDDLRKAWTSR